MESEIAKIQSHPSWAAILRDDNINHIVALTAFVAQTLHMLEHVAQMYQHVVLGLPTKLANGLLFFLDLEWNHFLFNSIYLIFLLVIFARLRFWTTRTWGGDNIIPPLFVAGFAVQSYHVVEHSVRMYQFLTTGCTPCIGVIGRFFNMIHLHFFLNLIAYLPLLLLLIKSGTLNKLFKISDEVKGDVKVRLRLFESPAPVLSILLVYGVFTGYSVDVSILGIVFFATLAFTLLFSIFEGRLLGNFLDVVGVSILALMSINMSYISAVFLVLLSLFSSRLVRSEDTPRINHIALSMSLLLLISAPALVASRWGTYNLYTFFTFLLLLGVAWAALSKSLDVVFIYVFSWILLFIPMHLARLESTFWEVLLLFPSAALKTLTNPLFGLLAFFIVTYPQTFPQNRWRYFYPLSCSGLAYILSNYIPVDLAAYSAVAISNIAFVVYTAYRK